MEMFILFFGLIIFAYIINFFFPSIVKNQEIRDAKKAESYNAAQARNKIARLKLEHKNRLRKQMEKEEQERIRREREKLKNTIPNFLYFYEIRSSYSFHIGIISNKDSLIEFVYDANQNENKNKIYIMQQPSSSIWSKVTKGMVLHCYKESSNKEPIIDDIRDNAYLNVKQGREEISYIFEILKNIQIPIRDEKVELLKNELFKERFY